MYEIAVGRVSCIENSGCFKLNIYRYRTSILYIILILSGDIHTNPGPFGQNNLAMCHLNARSLTAPNRLTEIEDFVTVLNDFDIVGITETHLDQSIPDSKISLTDYNVFRNDRNRRGGGVCLYVKDYISTNRKLDLESADYESVWVDIKIGDKKFLFACCYRPPGQNTNDIDLFLNSLNDSIEPIVKVIRPLLCWAILMTVVLIGTVIMIIAS